MTYSLEFGGIKIESPKCIANQISPFYVGTMRGTVSVTKNPAEARSWIGTFQPVISR